MFLPERNFERKFFSVSVAQEKLEGSNNSPKIYFGLVHHNYQLGCFDQILLSVRRSNPVISTTKWFSHIMGIIGLNDPAQDCSKSNALA